MHFICVIVVLSLALCGWTDAEREQRAAERARARLQQNQQEEQHHRQQEVAEPGDMNWWGDDESPAAEPAEAETSSFHITDVILTVCKMMQDQGILYRMFTRREHL